MNWLTEVADADLLSYGLGMRTKLNTRYNKTHGRIAAKLTDTTGMSRSAIPTFLESGVDAIHIGYNGVGGLPLVSSNGSVYATGSSFCGKDKGCPAEAIFRWVEPTTKKELLTMIEASYGNEIDVPLAGGASEASILRSSAAPDVALVFHFFMDNSGVTSAEEVSKFWHALQAKHPKVRRQLPAGSCIVQLYLLCSMMYAAYLEIGAMEAIWATNAPNMA